MVLKNKITHAITLFATVLMFGFSYYQTNFSERVYKKVDKHIAKLWPGQTITRKSIKVNSAESGFTINPGSLFLLENNGKKVGYAFLDKANSKSAQFDYVVFFDNNLKIISVQVLIYREDYGGEIGSTRWLKQFRGKYNGNEMVFQKDIQNITGATISSRNITKGIQKLSQQIVALKKNNLLP